MKIAKTIALITFVLWAAPAFLHAECEAVDAPVDIDQAPPRYLNNWNDRSYAHLLAALQNGCPIASANLGWMKRNVDPYMRIRLRAKVGPEVDADIQNGKIDGGQLYVEIDKRIDAEFPLPENVAARRSLAGLLDAVQCGGRFPDWKETDPPNVCRLPRLR